MSNFDEAIGDLICGKFTATPSPQKNLKIFFRILAGSEEATDNFITSNIRLVSHAITNLIIRHPNAKYLGDDMFSEGILTFTAAIHTLVKKHQDESDYFESEYMVIDSEGRFAVITYIYISIYRAVQRLYERDSFNLISENQKRRHTPIAQTKPMSRVNVTEEGLDVQSRDTFREIDFLEDILDSCFNEQEEVIIMESILNRDREVAAKLGVSRCFVWEAKQRVYERFCAKNCYDPGIRYNRISDEGFSDSVQE